MNVVPDLGFRDRAEGRMTRVLSGLLARQYKKLRGVMGDGSDIPETYWPELEAELTEKVLPALQDTAEQGAELLLSQVPQPKASVLEIAIKQWLETYGFNLIKDITSTTRDIIQDSVADYLTGGIELRELTDKIASAFGPDRALRIAVTETTRAYDQGDQIATKNLTDAGFEVKDIWNTNNDGLVDKDCEDRDGLKSEEWPTPERPPLHPNCRCWITHSVFS